LGVNWFEWVTGGSCPAKTGFGPVSELSGDGRDPPSLGVMMPESQLDFSGADLEKSK